ncbi:hypothetical protein [Nocardioides lijunqiniae]|uniref:hypothetical protein n=1 Tax=Nocardioides lijunqiniae TaxID=2760832 RepID=UPI00187870FB|nr:hypothetical protein [Nocardioides lijunqiniae]
MTLEDRLARSLHEGLARLDVPPGDLDGARRAGGRLRRRRRVVAAVVAAAVAVTGLGVLAWDREADDRVTDPAGSGSWQRMDDAPVPGRAMPLAGWTGEEALFVGGDLEPCPPAADCVVPSVPARDGAAYDPDAQEWRVIAEAPVPMGYWFRTTMVDDTMVIVGDGRWWAYDAGDDAWTRLPAPPAPTEDTGSISSADGRVLAMSRRGRVQVLDLAARTWSELPAAPRRLVGAVVATDDGVVVSGPTRGDGTGVVAQIWDGSSWSEVPVPQRNSFRHWTGERLVELDPQRGADGERAGGILDPATREWSPLPDRLTDSAGGGWSVNAAEGPLILGWGYLYDDRDGSWARQAPRPEAAQTEGVSAVWADGRVIVFGGVDSSAQSYEPVSQAWAWRP